MSKRLLLLISLVAVSQLAGCGKSREQIQQERRIDEIKAIYQAAVQRMQAGETPTLEEICDDLSLDAEEYVTTKSWFNRDAPMDAVVLRRVDRTISVQAHGGIVTR